MYKGCGIRSRYILPQLLVKPNAGVKPTKHFVFVCIGQILITPFWVAVHTWKNNHTQLLNIKTRKKNRWTFKHQ
jgi:hypothetical protein